MPFYTDQNGFPYYVDDETGKITTPVSQPAPVVEKTQDQPAPTSSTLASTTTSDKPDFTQGTAPAPNPGTIGASPNPDGGPQDQPAPPNTSETPSEPAGGSGSSSGDTWKPDFTKPDPWAGMPEDYAGIGSFNPTPDNPTPPWEQPTGDTKAGETTKAGDTTTKTGETAPPPGIPKFGTEEYDQRAQEIALKKLKQYKMGDEGYDIDKAIEDGNGSYLRAAGFRASDIKAAETRVERAKYTSAELKKRDDALDSLADFKTADGGYDLVAAIRAGKIKAIRAAGFDSLAIVDAQAGAANLPVIEAAHKALEPYTDRDGKVAGYEYLRRNPNDQATLRAVGFDQATIDKWAAYAEIPAVKANPIDKYHDAVLAAGGKPIPASLDVVLDKMSDADIGRLALDIGYSPQGLKEYRQWLKDHPDVAKERSAALAAARKSGNEKPNLSLEAFTTEYVAARQDNKATRDEAGLIYKNLYGTNATVKSEAVRFTSDWVFAPARALYPEVDTKDISLREWGMGTIQVGLLLVPGARAVAGPYAGRLAATGTEAVGAGLMTAGIAKDWNKMEAPERALSIGIDTLVLASALNRITGAGDKILTKMNKPPEIRDPKTGKTVPWNQYFENHGMPQPQATQETMSKALVKMGANPQDVDAALTQIRQGMATGDKKLLTAGAKRLQVVGRQVPKELGGPALEDYAKNLIKNPDDYLKLGTGEGISADEIAKVNESLKANQKHLELIEEQLKKTKNENIKETLKAEREKVQKIVKTQEQTKILLDEKVIMPDEAGRNVPAPRTSTTTALTVKSKAGRAEPVRVIPETRTQTKGAGKAPPPTKTATGYGKPKPANAPTEAEKPNAWDLPDYRPGDRPAPKTTPAPGSGTAPADQPKVNPKPGQKPEEKTRPKTLPEEKTKPVEKPAEGTQTKPETKTQPAPDTRTKPEEKTKTQPKPDTKTKPEEKTAPKPEIKTPTYTGTKTKTPPPLPKLKGGPVRPWNKADLTSAAAYSAGIGVWGVRKPGAPEDWRFWRTEDAPAELKVTDRRTAYDTIRLWKGTKGFTATRDMGIVDVTINPTRTPGAPGAIHFKADRSNWPKRPRTAPSYHSPRAGVPASNIRSKKVGRMFRTNFAGGSLLSRHPLGRKHR